MLGCKKGLYDLSFHSGENLVYCFSFPFFSRTHHSLRSYNSWLAGCYVNFCICSWVITNSYSCIVFLSLMLSLKNICKYTVPRHRAVRLLFKTSTKCDKSIKTFHYPHLLPDKVTKKIQDLVYNCVTQFNALIALTL